MLRSQPEIATALSFAPTKSVSPTTDIGRDDANTEGKEPLYKVYKVGPVKLYTVESILRV